MLFLYQISNADCIDRALASLNFAYKRPSKQVPKRTWGLMPAKLEEEYVCMPKVGKCGHLLCFKYRKHCMALLIVDSKSMYQVQVEAPYDVFAGEYVFEVQYTEKEIFLFDLVNQVKNFEKRFELLEATQISGVTVKISMLQVNSMQLFDCLHRTAKADQYYLFEKNQPTSTRGFIHFESNLLVLQYRHGELLCQNMIPLYDHFNFKVHLTYAELPKNCVIKAALTYEENYKLIFHAVVKSEIVSTLEECKLLFSKFAEQN